jgi:hypothetical protein
MDIQAFTNATTRTVVAFTPDDAKRYQNIETLEIFRAGVLEFDCGHGYVWHPHGLETGKHEPAPGDRMLCAECIDVALRP